MANMLIVPPLPISSATASRGAGGSNLLTPDPKEVWQDSATGGAPTLTFDLGAVQAIDTVFLGFTNAGSDAQWAIQYGLASGSESTMKVDGPLRAPDSIGPRHHGLYFRAAGTVNARYVKLTVSQPSGSPLNAGVVLIGKAFQPTWNRDWGPARRLVDTGSKTALRGGGFGTARGARKSLFQWTLGELTDAEVRAMWAIAKAVGETDPVLVVEDPAAAAGLNEGIYYGLFNRFEPYDREDPDWTQWGFAIEEWA